MHFSTLTPPLPKNLLRDSYSETELLLGHKSFNFAMLISPIFYYRISNKIFEKVRNHAVNTEKFRLFKNLPI